MEGIENNNIEIKHRLYDSDHSEKLMNMNLSSSLHGFQCCKGELWLSSTEVEDLNNGFENQKFRFIPIVAENINTKGNKKNRISMLSIKSQKHEDQNKPFRTSTSNDNINKTVYQGVNLSCADSLSDNVTSSLESSFENTSANHFTGILSNCNKDRLRLSRYHGKRCSTDRSSVTKRLSMQLSQIPTIQQSVNGNSVDLTVSHYQLSKNNPPSRYLRRRKREILSGYWIDTCIQIMDLLEKESSSRWFLVPVDPEAESIPDYLEKITCPMDFYTIRQKLLYKMYTHPFRWQEDIRTVFYNAFTYHDSGNLIWNDAFILANKFEQLCKQYEGVNPYAIYDISSGSHENENHSDDYNTSIDNRNPKIDVEEAYESGIDISEPDLYREKDTIVMKASKLRELLQKAAQALHENAVKEPESSRSSLCSNTSMKTSKDHTHEINDLFEVTNISSQMSDLTAISQEKNKVNSGIVLNNSQPDSILPPSTLPNPPPPPVITTMRPGDKVPNIIHRRLVSTQFRQLDIHLRRAALELVKDELGINPLVACCDNNFKIDLDMLPFLKQKQLLTYLRTLDVYQKRKIDEGYQIRLSVIPTVKQDQSSVDVVSQLQVDPSICSNDRSSAVSEYDFEGYKFNHFIKDSYKHVSQYDHNNPPLPSSLCYISSPNEDSSSITSDSLDDYPDHNKYDPSSFNNIMLDNPVLPSTHHSGKGKMTIPAWDDNSFIVKSNAKEGLSTENINDSGHTKLSPEKKHSQTYSIHNGGKCDVIINNEKWLKYSDDKNSDLSSFDLSSDVSSFSSTDLLDVNFRVSLSDNVTESALPTSKHKYNHNLANNSN